MVSKQFLAKTLLIGLGLSLMIFACKQEYIYVGEVNPNGTGQDTTSTNTGGTGTNTGGSTTVGKPCSPDSIYFELTVLLNKLRIAERSLQHYKGAMPDLSLGSI